ncbi:hypothetical protein BCR44DRAFT_1441985 [Catenaria anguillulae PL171]|uniref:Uncharacterized protein n=1 Tax=Catenaria anguillulae PL171 TaxID=765915 RepID=A0A1Y2HC26_9FUNG|nr:hypothetical protein BCR44DRAFT_1441985 [Catenaria anguillulae PL171]
MPPLNLQSLVSVGLGGHVCLHARTLDKRLSRRPAAISAVAACPHDRQARAKFCQSGNQGLARQRAVVLQVD